MPEVSIPRSDPGSQQATNELLEQDAYIWPWGGQDWLVSGGATQVLMNGRVPYTNLPNAGGSCAYATRRPLAWRRGLLFYEYYYTSATADANNIGLTEQLWTLTTAQSIGSPSVTSTAVSLVPPATMNFPVLRPRGPSIAVNAGHVSIGLSLDRDVADAHGSGARILGGAFIYYPERR